MIELQREEHNHSPSRICSLHKEYIVGICRSPYCDNYRELCPTCRQSHPHNEYLSWNNAVEEVSKMLKGSLDQLQVTRIRKNADMQNYMRNNMALLQMENNLKQIKKLIEQKIEQFSQNVNRIYQEHVKEKLFDLDEIIAKSQKTLKKQFDHIKEQPYQSLARFFTKDLLHQVKYYDSYFNEIFIKKTRNFRTALQHDRILTLIVTFQQNLEKIFTFNLEKTNTDHRQFHLFRQEQNGPSLYSLNIDGQKIQKKELPKIAALVNLPQNYDYQWHGPPQSLFYKPNNCYYIMGQGSKTSRLIVKWQCTKALEDSFYAVRSMDTERRQFGVCELGGEIYIIGGENEKDGCLARCEKFVPLYSSQIYIIHSLNTRSSKHSLTTYKNKYILKFGGVKKLLPPNSPIGQDITAPTEIYSVQTEEWSIIPIKRELQVKFGIYPNIFKAESKSMLLILGGDEQRMTFSMVIEDSKGGVVQQMKMKTHKSKLNHRGHIFNSTIRVDEEENVCTFMNSTESDHNITLAHIKLYK